MLFNFISICYNINVGENNNNISNKQNYGSYPRMGFAVLCQFATKSSEETFHVVKLVVLSLSMLGAVPTSRY